MERDKKLDQIQTENNLAEKDRTELRSQLESGSAGGAIANKPTGTVAAGREGGMTPANETEEELFRVQDQNAQLKEQVEALNHVQAKLVSKLKRYRDLHKSNLEG